MHPALDNLCGPGKSLKPEAPDANELAGLLRTGIVRLLDVDERLVNDLIDATAAVAKAIQP
jgi:hypothetical protein